MPDDTENTLPARITELEIKLAYQEQGQEDLHHALLHMQGLIDGMAQEILALQHARQSTAESAMIPMKDETPPPHY